MRQMEKWKTHENEENILIFFPFCLMEGNTAVIFLITFWLWEVLRVVGMARTWKDLLGCLHSGPTGFW